MDFQADIDYCDEFDEYDVWLGDLDPEQPEPNPPLFEQLHRLRREIVAAEKRARKETAEPEQPFDEAAQAAHIQASDEEDDEREGLDDEGDEVYGFPGICPVTAEQQKRLAFAEAEVLKRTFVYRVADLLKSLEPDGAPAGQTPTATTTTAVPTPTTQPTAPIPTMTTQKTVSALGTPTPTTHTTAPAPGIPTPTPQTTAPAVPPWTPPTAAMLRAAFGFRREACDILQQHPRIADPETAAFIGRRVKRGRNS